ncbi:hypothetical protein GCM10028778_04180 [Barrientosiimonas marina]|uniref:Uncharacterized protein n=1 Tax=Lentibacillus kimchii TaxID=1542911 RepID=A0ABW2URZ3_9BACI
MRKHIKKDGTYENKQKTIISNNLLFVGIMAFIFAFMALFGSENILIGISTITAMLMSIWRA